MKKSKKLLSVLLAVLIAMSSLTVGFAAFAADAKDKSTAVQDAEAAVDAFTKDHKYNLYSTNADKKKAAREALDKAAEATKKLSDKERAEMDKAKFTSLASYVAQLVANEEKSPSNDLKAEVLQNEEKLAQLEEKIGTLPQTLKEAIDAMAPLMLSLQTVNIFMTKCLPLTTKHRVHLLKTKNLLQRSLNLKKTSKNSQQMLLNMQVL